MLARGYMDVRKKVLKPFKPYYRYTGTDQAWRMFVAPHRYPARLEIDLLVGSEWRPIYKARDPELAWREHQLGHDRFRAAIFRFSWKPYRKHYDTFTTWVATRAAADFPEARSVRTRFYKYKTLDPEQVRAGEQPEGKYILTQVMTLSDYREEHP